MIIVSKIKRPKGTFINMQDGTRYAFVPNDAGDHVAEVTNPKHIERLLSIPEGYGVYSGEVIPESVVAAALASDAPENDDLPPLVNMPLEHMTLADLQATFERELGRKPHHRAGMDKLIEDITAHRENQE